jgi:acylphosphatase
MIRITYFLSGVVQGVGMRFTTLQIAQKFRVAGTVENLDDGRVKIIAEGDFDELGRFILSVQELTSGRIKTIEQFESEPMHDFIDFSIKR